MLVFLQCPFGTKKINKVVINNKLNRVGGYPPTTKVAGFPASSIMKMVRNYVKINVDNKNQ